VKAFGLNRAELFTRQGHSPDVIFPRVLGIEAAGIVEAAPGGEFTPGTVVTSAMGGMGRQFDGGYSEFTLVPAAQVQAIQTELSWELLGSIPQMLQTAWGSLFKSLRIETSHGLLIRGGLVRACKSGYPPGPERSNARPIDSIGPRTKSVRLGHAFLYCRSAGFILRQILPKMRPWIYGSGIFGLDMH
jgi:hypothetical protein